MSVLRKLIATPWFIFLLLGGLAYALYPNPQDKPVIHLSRGQLDSYLESFREQFPRQYTPEMEQRLIQQLVGEEALLRQAFALGYQQLPVVQDRLKKLGSFLQEDSEQPSDEELVARATDLGLLESDPVIRRYLVSVMERALVASVAIEITDEEIEAYFKQHVDEFVHPARVGLSHVFFSEDRGRNREYAAAVRRRLVGAGVNADMQQALEQGDVFYSGHQFAGKNETQLASIFGVDFAREAFRQDTHEWSEPIQSAYGWHLVWLDSIVSPVTPPLDEVEDKIIARIRQDKEKAVLAERIETLKQGYDIIIDGSNQPGAAT